MHTAQQQHNAMATNESKQSWIAIPPINIWEEHLYPSLQRLKIKWMIRRSGFAQNTCQRLSQQCVTYSAVSVTHWIAWIPGKKICSSPRFYQSASRAFSTAKNNTLLGLQTYTVLTRNVKTYFRRNDALNPPFNINMMTFFLPVLAKEMQPAWGKSSLISRPKGPSCQVTGPK